jgi:hypothetical protein
MTLTRSPPTFRTAKLTEMNSEPPFIGSSHSLCSISLCSIYHLAIVLAFGTIFSILTTLKDE